MRPSRLRPSGFLLLATLAACTSDQPGSGDAQAADVGGTLVLVVPARPGSMLPIFAGAAQSKQVTDLVYERLAEIGPDLNTVGDEGFEPRLARSWEWSADSLAITFHLDPAARWHDGQPVRAEDVRLTFELNQDPEAQSIDAEYLANIDSVTTPDSLTVTVWAARRTPEQFYDAGGRLSILPAHVLAGAPRARLAEHPLATAPMGSGPFRFVRAVPDQLVELAADTAYHLGRPPLDRVVISIAGTPVAATTQLLAGDADVYEALRPENMAQVAQAPNLVARIVPAASYGFLMFNVRAPGNPARPHPIFGDHATRRALSMLVDRARLTSAVFDSLAVVGIGPFPRVLPVADTTLRQIPFDVARGEALLDSLGWRDSDGDGVRDRGGRPLVFTLTVPSSSSFRTRMAELLQRQLADAGVKVNVDVVEFNVMGSQLMAGRFDAAIHQWALGDGSPAGLQATWGVTDGKPSAQNFGGYVDPVFEAEIDSGLAAFDRTSRQAHFSRAFQTILDDAPAVWIYEPRQPFGIHARFEHPPLRAASWWLDLPRWSVPADRRIDRDRAGLPAIAGR
ncbi:MAG TPA: peptide ABC transporter substrate-binding protein [Gemmatimonadaceae bacterium]